MNFVCIFCLGKKICCATCAHIASESSELSQNSKIFQQFLSSNTFSVEYEADKNVISNSRIVSGIPVAKEITRTQVCDRWWMNGARAKF